jgi:hypothetical protein
MVRVGGVSASPLRKLVLWVSVASFAVLVPTVVVLPMVVVLLMLLVLLVFLVFLVFLVLLMFLVVLVLPLVPLVLVVLALPLVLVVLALPLVLVGPVVPLTHVVVRCFRLCLPLLPLRCWLVVPVPLLFVHCLFPSPRILHRRIVLIAGFS